ncbi:DUF2631 domain-containing protein [Pseudonocardia endophytica]|uniref:Uncharacterized protein DUF2631 n=1 Tax=Pseudonocardia endophytica TaxID=401976 RepID=A0A4R1HVE4_PSEEN|nr:DUF2631 domain-containing protein [Pseudonocardia endophytica]TCK25401.1 uncharacterized protein DUF2631 [Pseudonocardia endophytica]
MASNSREVAIRSGVDPDDEPSVDWGWHGTFPHGTKIAGVVTAIALCVFLIGHPTSWTEILFMVVPAAAILLGVVWSVLRKRNSWRR